MTKYFQQKKPSECVSGETWKLNSKTARGGRTLKIFLPKLWEEEWHVCNAVRPSPTFPIITLTRHVKDPVICITLKTTGKTMSRQQYQCLSELNSKWKQRRLLREVRLRSVLELSFHDCPPVTSSSYRTFYSSYSNIQDDIWGHFDSISGKDQNHWVLQIGQARPVTG